MIPAIWTRRACAAAALVCGGLALSGAVGIVGDTLDVRSAQAATPGTAHTLASAPTAAPSAQWVRPEPVLRLEGGDGKARIGEYFNGQLGTLNLLATSIEVTGTRPLGDGLRLVEVTVKGKGGLDAAQSLAEWVAVNREAMRATSLNIVPSGDEAAVTLTLLIVVA